MLVVALVVKEGKVGIEEIEEIVAMENDNMGR
jgi:hypothetical protein